MSYHLSVTNLIAMQPDTTLVVSTDCPSQYAGMTFIRTWPSVSRTFRDWSGSLPDGNVIYLSSTYLARCLLADRTEAVSL